jgi:hypothetical protein
MAADLPQKSTGSASQLELRVTTGQEYDQIWQRDKQHCLVESCRIAAVNSTFFVGFLKISCYVFLFLIDGTFEMILVFFRQSLVSYIDSFLLWAVPAQYHLCKFLLLFLLVCFLVSICIIIKLFRVNA